MRLSAGHKGFPASETPEELFVRIRIGVVGLGGSGSHIAQQSAYLGIGRFAFFDPDFIDVPNLNRTVGAARADVIAKTPKVDSLRACDVVCEVWAIQTEWQK